MKHKTNKRMKFLTALTILGQMVNSALSPILAHAEVIHPQEVTIEYSASELHNMTGTFSDGTTYSRPNAPIYSVFNGKKQPVFCIEPTVLIPNEVTHGYEKNPLPDISKKAKLTSVLWKHAGADTDTMLAAQTMIWHEVNGLNISTITRPDGTTIDNLDSIRERINQVIADYQKQPSFHEQVANVALGKSITLEDTNNANLASFDKVVENTANVDYFINGNQITITPNENSKESGVLRFEKSSDAGTPVTYKKAGLQTVMAGAIDEPNFYELKIQVEQNGSVKIIKRDKESGDIIPNTVFHLYFGGVLESRDVKTGADGSVVLESIPHGTKVIITEKEVPAPYTIDPTPFEAVIQAGETIEVTSQNQRAKGQIILDKAGAETGTELWNEHYSLAGNTFDIRKDSIDGDIVQTIVTDEKGHAESSKETSSALELGTYYVTENKASEGFVNTFEPVKVELIYDNQTVPIIIQNISGTNQEITGKSSLKKVDKETAEETQGSATFKGAEYTLFYGENLAGHKENEPLKWTDKFKPELSKGKTSKNPFEKDSVTVVIDDSNQVGIKHLPLGKYYWKETKAPVGYTLDKTKYFFEIQKKDDSKENAIITQDVTAKEQVIRFGFDFFKFANSTSGSASAGFNDLKFKLTPIEPTKEITGAKDTVTTAHEPILGFDGYGKFENIPFGNYRFEEVEAPVGYEKIKPLVISSNFEENKDNYADSQYVFTITEEGQKEPIKTVKVSYQELTNEAFSVSLNRLMLYDLPKEKNSITSLAAWKNGEKEITALENTDLIDQLSYKLSDTKNDWFVVSKAVDIEATKAAQEKDKNAEPIIIAEKMTIQANKEKNGTWEIKHELPAEKILNKSIVLFNYVYENEEAYKNGKEPIAVDDQLDNQAQTVKVNVSKSVAIKTKAHTKEGSQTFTYGDILDMYDDVSITHDVVDGTKESFETILVAVHPEGKTEEIWKSGLIDYVVNDKEFTKTVVAEKVDTSKYPKGTLFTFREINYDQDKKVNAKHNDDLKEKTQTLTPKESPEKPEVPTTPKTPVTPKSYPKTGEKGGMDWLLIIGFSLIFIITGLYLWKHHSDEL